MTTTLDAHERLPKQAECLAHTSTPTTYPGQMSLSPALVSAPTIWRDTFGDTATRHAPLGLPMPTTRFVGLQHALHAYGTASHCGATQWSRKDEWHDTCHGVPSPSPLLGLARRLFQYGFAQT